jgi:hypothetical protein
MQIIGLSYYISGEFSRSVVAGGVVYILASC